MVPARCCNASFGLRMPRAGDLALLSQSAAIAAGMAEWAVQHAIGFSAMVCLGDQIDVDLGDVLDYFAMDRHTRAILMYVEEIKHGRKFMSAARAAARTKPVIVVKARRLAVRQRRGGHPGGFACGIGRSIRRCFPPCWAAPGPRTRRSVCRCRNSGSGKSICRQARRHSNQWGRKGVLAADELIEQGVYGPARIADHATTRSGAITGLPPSQSG